MRKRFASHSVEEINAKKQTWCQRTPQKQITTSLLRIYLEDLKQYSNFEEYDIQEFTKILSRFYLDVRTL